MFEIHIYFIYTFYPILVIVNSNSGIYFWMGK